MPNIEKRKVLKLRQKDGGNGMPQITISLCKIAFKPQMSLFDKHDFKTSINRAIDPDLKLSPRYGRTWRFSLPQESDGYLIGQFGFISAGTEQRPDYDEKLKSFIRKTVDTKILTYSLWAIDLNYQILAFEIRPPDIKYQTFVGNFQDFLDAKPGINLKIGKVVETERFIEWVAKVDKVIKFSATLRPPNPNYSSHPDFFSELLEQTNADQAKLEFTKDKNTNESLNTEQGKTLQAIVEYGKVGYSTIVARGYKKDQPKYFDSRKRIPIDTQDVPKDVDDQSKWEHIKEAIRKFIK
jgi:hypothetical protein